MPAQDDLSVPKVVAETVVTATDIVVELALATGFLVLIIAIHGWLLTLASRNFSSRFALMTWQTPIWKVNALMGFTITLLVGIHLLESLIWTLPLWYFGIVANFRSAYSFVLEAYTTVGENVIVLPGQYRLIGPVIAMSGLFTFGWTGSALVYVMSQILRLEALRSRRSKLGGQVDPAEVRGPFGT